MASSGAVSNPPEGGSAYPPTPEAPGEGPSLSISQLAERTGVGVATLRMWERRHGFPTPARLDNGHRRYPESDVDRVRTVARRRDAGTRLDSAIALVREPPEPSSPSVFATLRRRHPHLVVHTLAKSTMLAVSWAIEDSFAARAEEGVLYAAFQREEHYRESQARWTELAATASDAAVFADFTESNDDRHPREVAVPRTLPMAREWAVVCAAPTLPVVLTAWELPGQRRVPDPDRLFEACWAADAGPVADALAVCAQVERAVRQPDIDAQPPTGGVAEPLATADPRAVDALYARIVAYVDRAARRTTSRARSEGFEPPTF